jgi:hypothetical protein
LTPAELAGRAAVLLDGAPGDAAARTLLAYVEAGGGLLALVSDGTWRGEAARLLPGTLGAAVDRSGERSATLGYLDYDHPAFALFKSPHSGDFSQARFLRYRAFQPEEGARVLARFDDGGAALVEATRGKGRLLVWTSALDGLASDLPVQPVFLPFVHRLVEHVAQHVESRPFSRVGEFARIEGDEAGGACVVVAPSGAERRVAERSFELEAAGFYEVRCRTARGETSQLVAADVNPAESDLSALDPEEVASALTSRGAERGDRAVATGDPEEGERRQSSSWFLLAATLVLLAGETFLSNRLSAATGVTAGAGS